MKDFAKCNAMPIGISADSVERQKKFEEKSSLGVTLLSDEKKTVLEKFGFWGEKKNYGKIFMGIIRSTALIDEKGKVAKVWRSIRAKGHAERVLKYLQEEAA